MIIAGTGHRPDKLGGYHAGVQRRLRQFAVSFLRGGPCTQGISGMALGWDMALAEAFVELGIPWIAAVPCEGQERMWPVESQRTYRDLLRRANEVEVIAHAYSRHAMNLRNEWMVDHCDEVAALWNGSPGGTANCVRHAEHVGRPVRHLWPAWLAYCPLRQ